MLIAMIAVSGVFAQVKFEKLTDVEAMGKAIKEGKYTFLYMSTTL